MEETIGNRIEKIIKELNITPKEFALSLKTDISHIKGIIQGKKKGSEKLYAFMCNKYNISLEWLESGKGNMYTDPNLANFSRVLELYKKLDLCHQEYMFYTLEKLYELQTKSQASNNV